MIQDEKGNFIKLGKQKSHKLYAPKMKFQVITSAVVATSYIVEAKSKQEAEEKFFDGDHDGGKELPDYDIDSQEEVIEINKVKQPFKCYVEHKRGKYGGCSIPHIHE